MMKIITVDLLRHRALAILKAKGRFYIFRWGHDKFFLALCWLPLGERVLLPKANLVQNAASQLHNSSFLSSSCSPRTSFCICRIPYAYVYMNISVYMLFLRLFLPKMLFNPVLSSERRLGAPQRAPSPATPATHPRLWACKEQTLRSPARQLPRPKSAHLTLTKRLQSPASLDTAGSTPTSGGAFPQPGRGTPRGATRGCPKTEGSGHSPGGGSAVRLGVFSPCHDFAVPARARAGGTAEASPEGAAPAPSPAAARGVPSSPHKMSAAARPPASRPSLLFNYLF